MGSRLWAVIAAMFLFAASAAQADEMVSLKVGYMVLSPSGDVRVEDDGIGTTIDLENDLGLEDSEDLMAEAALAFGDIKLTVGYLPLSFEGSSVLTRTVLFNGKTYSFGAPVEGTLDLRIFDVGLTYFLVNFDDAPTRFQLGVELAVKVTDAEATLTEKLTNRTETASENLPIPTLGLRTRIGFSDFVAINGRIGYLEISGNHFMDADVQVEFSPLPLVGIFAGYRYIALEVDESDVFVDTELSGFYGGAFVRF